MEALPDIQTISNEEPPSALDSDHLGISRLLVIVIPGFAEGTDDSANMALSDVLITLNFPDSVEMFPLLVRLTEILTDSPEIGNSGEMEASTDKMDESTIGVST